MKLKEALADDIMSKLKSLALTDVGGPKGILKPTKNIAANAEVDDDETPSQDFLNWQKSRAAQAKSKREIDEIDNFKEATSKYKRADMNNKKMNNSDIGEGIMGSLKKVAKAGLKNAAGELSDQIGNAQTLAKGALQGGEKGMADASKNLKMVGSRTSKNLGKWADSEENTPNNNNKNNNNNNNVKTEADEDDICYECGMIEGHATECSHMNESDDEDSYVDMYGELPCKNCYNMFVPRTETGGKALDVLCPKCSGEGDSYNEISESDEDEDKQDTSCPECGAPAGMKHDSGCPIGQDLDDTMRNDYKHDMSESEEDDDDYDYETEMNPEACPGCGAMPGDGVNPKCDDPLGCGYYWKEIQADTSGRSLRDMLKAPLSADDDGVQSVHARDGFETEDGMWIENPFWDEEGREEVNPDEHYGDSFKNSALARRLRWGENSDYDGLPLNESCMFDRFSTLVGHRSDGTFKQESAKSTPLRDVIIQIVKEMKLSVAGPAFGSVMSGYDAEDNDDENEDYKVLTPKKMPEPEKSATKLKKKSKS